MSRITEAILGDKAFGVGSKQPMLDLTHGGQGGYTNVLTEWVSNQAYRRTNLIPILLEAPKFFTLMPQPDKWVQTLKSLIELHSRTIEGFTSGLTVEFDEHPIGGAGEMQQEYTDVKRARSEPSFTFVEKYGMPIQTFLYNYITYGMMDPDTKYALVGTLDKSKVPSDLLADWNTFSMLLIEPDPTQRKVVKSWVTTNCMPKGTGEIIGKRDLSSASEILTLTIEFTGITQFNLGSNVFAQKILDAINLTNANPYLRPSFIQDIDKDVSAATKGYKKGVEDLGSSALSGVAKT